MTKTLFTLLLTATAAHSADQACRPVTDALEKLYTTPVHLYTYVTAAYLEGKTKTSESINLNHTTYLNIAGQWRTSPMTEEKRQQMRKQAEASSAKATCRLDRQELVNGEAVAVYSLHQQTPDEKVDTLIWISKSRGLPIRQEVDLDVGGVAGKSHRITHYDYKNVQAPAGVH